MKLAYPSNPSQLADFCKYFTKIKIAFKAVNYPCSVMTTEKGKNFFKLLTIK